jgi:hypothetical protein
MIFNYVLIKINLFGFVSIIYHHINSKILIQTIKCIDHLLLSILFVFFLFVDLKHGQRNILKPEKIIINPDVRKESLYVRLRSRNKPIKNKK